MEIISQTITRDDLNIRPHQGNRSRDVQNPDTRAQIIETVNRLIQ